MMIRWLLIFLFSIAALTAEENAFWHLKGHLDKERIAQLAEELSTFENNPPQNFAIAIDSTSGDLAALLDLTKKIYAFKEQTSAKIIVYINGNALGPSAILPFLADEIETSLFVSWGDIPLGSENVIPTNILRNQVIGFIPSNSPHRKILILLASAMTDPKTTVIDEDGWKISDGDSGKNRISVEGQTLVVNQNQLEELGIVKNPVSYEAFRKRFQKITPVQEEEPSLAIPSSKLDQELQEHIKPQADKKNTIGKITIDDRTSGISQATWIYVRNALEYYKKNPPLFIILELNTPGGEVYAAQRISDALKDFDTQYNIPIVTFINNWAISAGAMLAYSTRFITVVKDASMGAAEPITQDSSGVTQTASEKVNSAIRTDFANRAKFFGRNPNIAEAMVDKDLILVLRHGKIIKLDNENQIRTSSPDPDILISPKGKLLTLNAEELMNYGVADILLMPKQLPQITNEEKEIGHWPFKKELLHEYSFFSSIPEAEIDEYKMDWKTRFFSFLANPVVQSALFLGLLLGFYLEMNTPGFGLPGGIALTSLALIVLSSFSQELASWFELILLVIGLGIILVELFILPTFGFLGFIGVAFFLFGLFSLMLPGIGSVNFDYDTKTFNAAGEAFLSRLTWLSATLILGLGIIYFLARYFMPSFGGFQKFVLKGHEQYASQGYVSGPTNLPTAGEKGKALTQLRPSGKILINGVIYDALSSGKYIDIDASIIVTKIEGSAIFVREVKE